MVSSVLSVSILSSSPSSFFHDLAIVGALTDVYKRQHQDYPRTAGPILINLFLFERACSCGDPIVSKIGIASMLSLYQQNTVLYT